MKKDPLYYYLDYHESVSGGCYCDGEEGPYGMREDTIKEVEFIQLRRKQNKSKFYDEPIEVDERLLPLPYLYLAVVIYSTGNTFGRTEGCWHIVGLAPTEKVAEAMIEFALNDPKGYKPWEGYFERLTTTEVYKLNVI